MDVPWATPALRACVVRLDHGVMIRHPASESVTTLTASDEDCLLAWQGHQYPDPVLAAKAEPVTEFNDELRKLAADMAETPCFLLRSSVQAARLSSD